MSDKSQFEYYKKMKIPPDGYHAVHTQNGWVFEPLPRYNNHDDICRAVLATIFFVVFVILLVVGAMGVDNTIFAIKFFLGG